MAKISFAKLQEKYSGMYVLTDKPNGKIIAASRSLKKAFKEAEERGYKLPSVQFIEPRGTIHIYEARVSLRN